MNAVNINVSNGKNAIVILRPFGEIVIESFDMVHTYSDLKKLANFIKSLSVRVSKIMNNILSRIISISFLTASKFFYWSGLFGVPFYVVNDLTIFCRLNLYLLYNITVKIAI